MRMAKTETRLVGPNAAGLGLISPLSSSALSSTKGPDILLIDFLRPPPTGGPPTLFFLSFFFFFFPYSFCSSSSATLGTGQMFPIEGTEQQLFSYPLLGRRFSSVSTLRVCVCVCVFHPLWARHSLSF